MIVKKYQASTETEAVLKAKEDLGINAVVLNVKTLKQRGVFRLIKKDMVEITAALEEKEFVSSVQNKRPDFGAMQSDFIDYRADEKLNMRTESAGIEEKLDSLHNMLKNQIDKETAAALSSMQDSPAKKASEERENTNLKFLKLIYKKLIDNEVNEIYANDIIGEIESSMKKESNIDTILSGVYQKIILRLGEPKTITIGKKTKVVFFIGPTGVGKTTTIAKIASMFKLEEQCRVAFITSDTYRIAAVEQLNTYASIIDCPINVVYSAEELDECLEEFRDFDLIMVDTAGRSHKSEEQMTEVMELYNRVKGKEYEFDVEVYLTLSITTKYKDLANIAEAYREVPDLRLIFTKLDETCSLGNILNIKLLTGAPLSYTTYGQNVPNDIEVINEQGLAKQLLGGNE